MKLTKSDILVAICDGIVMLYSNTFAKRLYVCLQQRAGETLNLAYFHH
jgi:hypothetical protein